MKFTICSIKNSLNAAINSVASNQNLYAKNPNKDFSRVRKLPFNDLIRMIISSGGKSNNKELLDFFHFSPSLASSSAFVQARGKILPQAFYDVFHNFTYSALSAKKFCDYRLLAVDGSDLTIPTNYKDAESFVKSTPRDYNILHINALFDLHNRIYLDASVQKLRNKNEHLALCSMIDNSPINDKAVIIADRGYESYNNMAHIELKNWKYVIRVKETNGIISKLLLPEKEEFDMPVNIILSRSQTKAQSYPEKYRFLATTSTFDFIGKDDKKSEFPLSFRLVRFKTNCGTATVVTNLPEAEFPIDKIKLIYKKRWGIETSFRLLKYSVCLNCFHSKKADFIIQEIFARLIMFNFSLFISLCIEVMHKNTKYTYEINITELIYICRRYIRNEISPQNVDALVRRNTVPIRPSMNSERKIKAKTSTSFMYRIS